MLLPESLVKPKICPGSTRLIPIRADSQNRVVLEGLKKGKKYCFEGSWGTALAFYSWIKQQVLIHHPIYNYASSRISREASNKLTQHLYMPVKSHHPGLSKAPGNPWLKDFYPDQDHFFLRFTDYLGMNGARQWYEKGILYPGLNVKLHPFYGTYFPTRTEHLQMFDEWLLKPGDYQNAIEIGTGCGVLSFYMLKHGIKKITATDTNPNALFSFHQDLLRSAKSDNVQLIKASFFENLEFIQPDLVVFNPPWLPMESFTNIDKAMYYPPDFFEEFFHQAHNLLPSTCRLLIFFSNYAEIAEITSKHPIKDELESNSRFSLIEKTTYTIQQKTSSRKDWLSLIRSREEAEIWYLKKVSVKI
jgi:hypothetical protein